MDLPFRYSISRTYFLFACLALKLPSRIVYVVIVSLRWRFDYGLITLILAYNNNLDANFTLATSRRLMITDLWWRNRGSQLDVWEIPPKSGDHFFCPSFRAFRLGGIAANHHIKHLPQDPKAPPRKHTKKHVRTWRNIYEHVKTSAQCTPDKTPSELELKLIQTHLTQKQVLRVEVGACRRAQQTSTANR